jgi:hypothetical protein
VNQKGKTILTLSGTAWKGNGLGAAWERHGMFELALTLQILAAWLTFSPWFIPSQVSEFPSGFGGRLLN